MSLTQQTKEVSGQNFIFVIPCVHFYISVAVHQCRSGKVISIAMALIVINFIRDIGDISGKENIGTLSADHPFTSFRLMISSD